MPIRTRRRSASNKATAYRTTRSRARTGTTTKPKTRIVKDTWAEPVGSIPVRIFRLPKAGAKMSYNAVLPRTRH